MAPPSLGVKGPSEDNVEEMEEEIRTGRLSQADFASWFGNSLFLVSLGTLALIVSVASPQLRILSDGFIACALAILAWASMKYFFINPKKHHWSDWILFVIILAVIAFFVWLVVII